MTVNCSSSTFVVSITLASKNISESSGILFVAKAESEIMASVDNLQQLSRDSSPKNDVLQS
jgi:hypothetical protein